MEDSKMTLGWKEWIALPDLNIPAIKAKLDTGAKTSALHAFNLETYSEGEQDFIRFSLHPLHNDPLTVSCEAPLLAIRKITNSGGHSEKRYIIETTVVINQHSWLVELSLTNRDTMNFRMLLGREAMATRIIVDPESAFLISKPKKLLNKS